MTIAVYICCRVVAARFAAARLIYPTPSSLALLAPHFFSLSLSLSLLFTTPLHSTPLLSSPLLSLVLLSFVFPANLRNIFSSF